MSEYQRMWMWLAAWTIMFVGSVLVLRANARMEKSFREGEESYRKIIESQFNLIKNLLDELSEKAKAAPFGMTNKGVEGIDAEPD